MTAEARSATNPIGWARPLAVGSLVALGSTAAGAVVAAIFSVDSPVAAVAGRAIDMVPKGIREWAIETFGTNDKLALGIGIVVVLTLVATVVARYAVTRRWLATLTVCVFALVGVAAVDDPSPGTVLSALASALMAYTCFALLLPPMRDATRFVLRDDAPGRGFATQSEEVAEPMVIHRWEAPVDRRRFVTRAGALWAGTAVMGGVAATVNRSDSASVTAARAKLPTVRPGTADAAPEVPGSASVGGGVEPFITPNEDFYRIDTSYVAPRITLADWRLEVEGAVDNPLSLTYDDLLDRHVVERVITLCCVSNEVGGNLVGTARFLGVPLSEILEEAGVRPGGTQIAMTSSDGWTCGFPTDIALDGRDAMLAIGMNGEPLPIEHGFPVRVVVPGLYGYVSATKWLTNISLVGWDDFDGYWIPRGWSKEGPVKTQSRIDVPRAGASVATGRTAVAGVAFAQHRGIDRVEVRVDDGPWNDARLGDEVTVDAWRQWVYEWDAEPGEHRISVRATDSNGDTQPAERAPVAPDGATGHHTITVNVG